MSSTGAPVTTAGNSFAGAERYAGGALKSSLPMPGLSGSANGPVGNLLKGPVDDTGKLKDAALLVGIKLDLEAEVHATARLAAPWDNKIALVVGTQISTFKLSYLPGLSWGGTTTIGHTKKLSLLAYCVVAISVANMISPQFWQPRYKPRYTLPWAFMAAFWLVSLAMCIWIRFHLQRENERRPSLLEKKGSDEENEVLNAGS
ncbi:hypothetical protein F4814DRAFT_454197 [Daldinia grandis]|nr:hypothetical protein F4814DRAFT_454197 [Daldinia grandis]